jgi:hypothetical protein
VVVMFTGFSTNKIIASEEKALAGARITSSNP